MLLVNIGARNAPDIRLDNQAFIISGMRPDAAMTIKNVMFHHEHIMLNNVFLCGKNRLSTVVFRLA